MKLAGKTVIGSDVSIGQYSEITNSQVGANVTIKQSVINEATIADEVTIGPFAQLRPGADLGLIKVKVGNFVEVKKSVVKKVQNCHT